MGDTYNESSTFSGGRAADGSNGKSDDDGGGDVEQEDAAAMPWMLPAVEDANPLGEGDFEDADPLAGGSRDCILPD